MAVTQTIKLDMNNHKADDIIIRVGESYTRKIVFIPGTYDGDEFTPTEFYGREEGPRAKFRLVKPDRTFVLQDLTVVQDDPDTGLYSFELVPDEYMSQVAGIGYYDIRINDSDTAEEFLYTVQGRVLIDDDMITDSMIESVAASNGMVFPDDFLTSADLDNYATKNYVDEAIAAIPDPTHIYSTEEHVVGVWLDGKPVYEKTFDVPCNYSPSTTYHDYAHGISNFGELVNVQATAKTTPLAWWSGNSFRPGLGNGFLVGADDVNIRWMNNWISPNKLYVTIQYTKTTD